MKIKEVFPVIKETFSEWQNDKALKLGAALSYYAVLSLPALLVIMIGVAGILISKEEVREQVVSQVQSIAGEQSKQVIETMIRRAFPRGRGILATLIGVFVLLLSATGTFSELQDSLNMVWEVKPKPGGGIRLFFRTRLLSLLLVIGCGLLLLAFLIVSTGVSAFGEYLERFLPGSDLLMVFFRFINFLILWAIAAILFTFIFKILPDVNIAWKSALTGAVFTSLLFMLGKFLISLYLGRSSVGSIYGAAGSLVVILLWIFYSSQIFFLGAEFTQVCAKHSGFEIVPKEYAMRIRLKEIAEGGSSLRK